ncbi:DgyrCDS6278 [Dimorphilus gyrociliatus]|uniref:ATP synthase F(0) complex subunit e, mitochondrial n=1 Tax=Dimorphilus gyrociliatus TaxID=2664684 RepID=A0A7I8VSD6_9ANNE|nr:DgyrCDS6278 [Dimorphilus gyrociliatus]
MVNLPQPRQVSPVIRACRWGALLAGIAYGSYRYSYLSRKEVSIQERENKIRQEYAAKKKAEEEKKSAIEMNDLAKEAGIIPNA